MTPGLAARSFRRFCLLPHFKGKSRLEVLLEPFIPLPPRAALLDFPDGFRMEIDPTSPFERGLYFREAEPDTARFFRAFLRPGMTVADCGANLGYYSLLASRLVGPAGRIYAYEPTSSTFERLARNIALSGCENVRAFACALGARAGRASVYEVEPTSHEMNSLAPAEGCRTVLEVCEVRALDELIAAGQMDATPDLVKIDVEGSELDLLRGAERLLREGPAPTLILELSRATTRRFYYQPEDLLAYLLSVRSYRIEWWFLGRAHVVDVSRPLPHYAILGPDHGANYVFHPL